MPEQDSTARDLARRLACLTVLRGCLQDEVLAALLAFLCKADADEETRATLYCSFVAALYKAGGDLGAHLARLVLESENALVRLRARGETEPPEMAVALDKELALMSSLSELDPRWLAWLARQIATDEGYATEAWLAWLVRGSTLPLFQNTPVDFAAEYRRWLSQIAARGYGIFAQHHMFTLGEGTRLAPVKNPDAQRLSQLTGYEQERVAVVLNTKALLRGLFANNILLYGDAGTGKSATVKALANEYHGEGLRLVEVRKNQLYQIPALMDELAENPLKFILFIDDLSFPENDGDFTALKAILEGNISARPQNIVVYATSNRRHLMRQRHADRAGDDVHRGDTLEEQASLSARFGLTITFLKPDKALYADIITALAREYALKTPLPQLLAAAEAHAIRYGGRSPRVARQFAQTIKAQEEVEP